MSKITIGQGRAARQKVGIYSGTFDPVHKGHIAFALRAAEAAGLDRVYFLPESMPWRKTGVTHYAHRIAMLKIATEPYNKLGVLDLPDKRFTVKQTLPRLRSRFKHARLHLLIGTDNLTNLNKDSWPGLDRLLKEMKLIVGLRGSSEASIVADLMQELIPDRDFYIVQTENRHANSSEIRDVLRRGGNHEAALQSLRSYIKKNWIYDSIAP